MLHTCKRWAVALAFPAFGLTGCYVVPLAPEATRVYPFETPASAVVLVPGLPSYPPAAASGAVAPARFPAVLAARLYPSNEIAAQHGVIVGTVTNLMTGKGRFQMDYRGEVLVGEATRVAYDEKRGVASAFGPQGTFMNCEYRMTTPRQGTGTCTLSNGAQYAVHLGG